jgi:hypothetical protein
MLHRLVRVRTYAEGEEEKMLLRGEEIRKVGKNRKKQIKNGYMEALRRILTIELVDLLPYPSIDSN